MEDIRTECGKYSFKVILGQPTTTSKIEYRYCTSNGNKSARAFMMADWMQPNSFYLSIPIGPMVVNIVQWIK